VICFSIRILTRRIDGRDGLIWFIWFVLFVWLIEFN